MNLFKPKRFKMFVILRVFRILRHTLAKAQWWVALNHSKMSKEVTTSRLNKVRYGTRNYSNLSQNLLAFLPAQWKLYVILAPQQAIVVVIWTGEIRRRQEVVRRMESLCASSQKSSLITLKVVAIIELSYYKNLLRSGFHSCLKAIPYNSRKRRQKSCYKRGNKLSRIEQENLRRCGEKQRGSYFLSTQTGSYQKNFHTSKQRQKVQVRDEKFQQMILV